MKFAWLAWRNLGRQKLRTALMLVAIVAAFALYGTLFGMDRLLGGDTVAGGRDLIVHHRAGLLQSVPAHYRTTLAQVPGVDSVAAVAIIGGYTGDRTAKVPTQMVDPEPYLAQNPSSIVLPADQRRDFLASRDAAVVDSVTARERGWSVGDQVVVTSEIAPRSDGSFDWPFRIAGIYHATDADERISGAIAHLDYYAQAAALRSDGVNWFAIRTADPALNDRIAGQIDARFANSDAETRTEPAAAMARAFLSQVVDFALVIRVVVAAAFVTVLMIVGNTIALIVRQRRREFGVLRAIGFDVRRISAMVVGEALLVTVVGAAIGLALSAGLLTLIAAAITGNAPSASALPIGVFAGGIGIACIFGIAVALLPTWRATRIGPAEAFSRS
ncbi:hypothetical protein ASE86_04115 [Sphingomonas sp. Leaf33]|uniref:ABC transporter permease n=1 Tax=Sphingomonas sp. Leaf33 TaxID=1736215 RepID=UPI0006F282E8|nr:ABC transporter permease [Sphingomonas sp. Leaf33]KQN25433.1 hypothetical protein ASE86_04115 [Sphingomonas sp. Leaf33]